MDHGLTSWKTYMISLDGTGMDRHPQTKTLLQWWQYLSRATKIIGITLCILKGVVNYLYLNQVTNNSWPNHTLIPLNVKNWGGLLHKYVSVHIPLKSNEADMQGLRYHLRSVGAHIAQKWELNPSAMKNISSSSVHCMIKKGLILSIMYLLSKLHHYEHRK